MKKLFFLILPLALLLACSSDNEEPAALVIPTADFSAAETSVETGSAITFTNNSKEATTYEWTFQGGDPATSDTKNPTITYNTSGTYNVSLKVTNADGEDIETKENYITVRDPSMPPTAQFTASTTDVDTGASITFTDESTNMPTSWSWEFQGGEPATSTDQNPTILYNTEGTYAVSLTVTNEDGETSETKADYIVVTDPLMPPTAQFSAATTAVDTGDSITFTDESTNMPTSWSWTFSGGEPATSTDQNPTILYNTEGTYAVSLTVTNEDGETSETKVDYIVVADPVILPETDFSASATTITSGQQVNFTDTSTNAPTSWSWEFEGGSPSISTDQNPEISYLNFGTYNVTLTASNAAGNHTTVKNGYITVNQQTASYTVTFTSNWTITNHPVDFPTGSDHFSSAVGMVHKSGTTFFEVGEKASEGIENMAETGDNSVLSDEINAIVGAGEALSYVAGGSLPNGTTERVFTIDVTEEFSMVTLVSMIAPSPDWFVAIENVALFESGAFLDNLSVDATSYDSGTDTGTTFVSGNADTDPAEDITPITTTPLGNGTTVDPRMAYFTFVKN